MPTTATCKLAVCAAAALALLPPTAQAAGWVPGPAVPISAPESAITMQTDAGADGTAAAVWSDGTTVRAALKPSGSATFGAPVIIGSGLAPDVAVGPGGRVLAVWAANDGLHASERLAGTGGFADLGVIGADAGTQNPQVEFFADGRAAVKSEVTGGIVGRIRQVGSNSFVSQPFSLPGNTISGSDLAVSDQAGEVVMVATVKSAGGVSQVVVFHLAGDSSTGNAGGRDPQTDTSSMFNSTTYQQFSPHVVVDNRVVATYITQKNVSVIVPTSETTTLRSLVDPAVGPVMLGDVDAVSNGGFFGPYLNNPSLIRRSDGTVTAAWVDTDLIGSPRLSTADMAPSATAFGAKDDVEGFGGATIVGATDMARLTGGALGLVASDGTAVRAATSPSGQPFGAPVDLVTGADTPSSALLAGDGLGGLVATWTQADGANRRAFTRFYDDAAPIVSGAVTPAALDAGQAGTFSATATDSWTGATPVWDFGDGQTASGASVSHAYAGGGLFAVSVRARDAAGNLSDKIERVVRVTGPPAGGPGPGPGGSAADTTAPVISGLSLARTSFAVAAAKRKAVVKRGTTVRFRLSEKAAVTMTVTRAVRGFRSGGRCVTKKPAGRKAARCTIQRRIGTVKANGGSGANSVPFKGRVSGRPLTAGSYRLALTAVDPAGNRSKQSSTSFTIVRAR